MSGLISEIWEFGALLDALGDLVVELSGVFLKLPLCFLTEGVAIMTVVKPDPVAIIFAVTLHAVVCEVTFRHLVIRIYHNLQDVISRFDVRDVDPLAVDVVSV